MPELLLLLLCCYDTPPHQRQYMIYMRHVILCLSAKIKKHPPHDARSTLLGGRRVHIFPPMNAKKMDGRTDGRACSSQLSRTTQFVHSFFQGSYKIANNACCPAQGHSNVLGNKVRGGIYCSSSFEPVFVGSRRKKLTHSTQKKEPRFPRCMYSYVSKKYFTLLSGSQPRWCYRVDLRDALKNCTSFPLQILCTYGVPHLTSIKNIMLPNLERLCPWRPHFLSERSFHFHFTTRSHSQKST